MMHQKAVNNGTYQKENERGRDDAESTEDWLERDSLISKEGWEDFHRNNALGNKDLKLKTSLYQFKI